MATKAAPTAKKPGPSSAAVYTLGQFRIEVDGEPLRFGQKAQRKPLDLLKLLIALGGNSIPLEKLTDSLWPDSDGDQVHGAFSTALHRLRKLIGHEAVLLANSRLTLNPKSCWVDCLAFNESLVLAARAATEGAGESACDHTEVALRLYGGPFLDGEFDLPEVLAAREKMHGIFLRNIGQLGVFFGQSGQLPKAIVLFQRGLEIDELAEEIYQKLMLVYQQLGRYAEGVSVYQKLQKVLKVSVGIEPSQETEAIYQALTSHNVKQPETVSAAPQQAVEPVMSGESPSLPDKPSIAVLPFENMSGDPEQGYFGHGLSEDITTALSRIGDIFVIARNSAFTYKGKSVDAPQVGREMGVEYVLEGSVRKASGRVRITAQLINAQTGHHLWAERYDRELADVFAVQDEIVANILTELRVNLTSGELARAFARSTEDSEALECLWRGLDLKGNIGKDQNTQARGWFKKALDLDPNCAMASYCLASSHFYDYRYGWSEDATASFKLAEELTVKALEMDANLGLGHSRLAMLQTFKREHDLAIEEARRGVMLEPNNYICVQLLAFVLRFAGKPEESIEHIRKAMRLAPIFQVTVLWVLGESCRLTGRYKEALAALEFANALAPNMEVCQVYLIAAYGETGQWDKAKKIAVEMHRQDTKFDVKAWADKALPYKDEEITKTIVAHCHQAGLP